MVLADGSLVQEHTAKNVDGLTPIGTVRPLLGRNWNDGDDEAGRTTPRLGVILNYSPARILYVSEPFDNTIAVLYIADDGLVFYVAEIHRIRSEALDQPVDLAPAAIETTNPNWASNTTLDVAADFYVANRGNKPPMECAYRTDAVARSPDAGEREAEQGQDGRPSSRLRALQQAHPSPDHRGGQRQIDAHHEQHQDD